MADLKDQDEQTRRRQRGIPFFDQGDSSPFEEKSPTSRGRRYQNASEQYAVQAVQYTIVALRALAIILTTVIVLGLSLRGIGSACTLLPFRTPGCRSTLIRSTHPYLSTFKNGTTPLTGTLSELTKVVQMAPSLSVLGTAMHLVSANFSSTHDELQAFPALFQTNASNIDNLTDTIIQAAGAAELFSRSDFSYRDQNLLWGRNGMESIGKMLDTYLHALNDSSTLSWSFIEQTMHRIPFGARKTPSYDIAYTYFYFGGQQWLEIEQLVHMANYSATTLNELIPQLTSLETHLEKVVAENKVICADYDPILNTTDPNTNSTIAALCHLDPSLRLAKVRNMRAASTWSKSVIDKAWKHYAAAFAAIKAQTDRLQIDVKGYTSILPAKGTVSTKKLRRLLEMEMEQLTKYTKEAQKYEVLMAHLGKKLTKGENVSKLHEHVDAHVVSKEGEGEHKWWGGLEEHAEL